MPLVRYGLDLPLFPTSLMREELSATKPSPLKEKTSFDIAVSPSDSVIVIALFDEEGVIPKADRAPKEDTDPTTMPVR
jgi:hypothetical protein